MMEATKKGHYGRLAIMAGLSFVSMYVLMYAMVDSLPNVYTNVNQFYMAGLMTAPMVVLELLLMGAMYHDKRLNAAIGFIATASLIAFFVLIRQQAAVSDEQFLKSMIPHHGAAILMCEQAPIDDADIRDLCQRITSGQNAEIDEMKAKLEELKGS
jgi:uncharacterized protein (DUF305 family)